jgi:hypothetical protein
MPNGELLTKYSLFHLFDNINTFICWIVELLNTQFFSHLQWHLCKRIYILVCNVNSKNIDDSYISLYISACTSPLVHSLCLTHYDSCRSQTAAVTQRDVHTVQVHREDHRTYLSYPSVISSDSRGMWMWHRGRLPPSCHPYYTGSIVYHWQTAVQ